MLSTPAAADSGDYSEPGEDLTYELFARALAGHVAAASGKITEL